MADRNHDAAISYHNFQSNKFGMLIGLAYRSKPRHAMRQNRSTFSKLKFDMNTEKCDYVVPQQKVLLASAFRILVVTISLVTETLLLL